MMVGQGEKELAGRADTRIPRLEIEAQVKAESCGSGANA